MFEPAGCATPSHPPATTKSNRIFIGLGSNLGDSVASLKQAAGLIAETVGVTPVTSAIYRSEPVEVTDQPWFYNQVLYLVPPVAAEWSPSRLLQALKSIENQMGRVTSFRYGPRLIDLDLLFFRDWVFESSYLTVPHPKVCERAFVLMPLVELDQKLVHPRYGEMVKEIFLREQPRLSECYRME